MGRAPTVGGRAVLTVDESKNSNIFNFYY